MSATSLETEAKPLRKARIICNLQNTEYDVIKHVVTESLNWRSTDNENDDWDIYWNDNYIPSDKLAKMRPYQKINHFPGMHGICKKNYLAWNLNKMLKSFPNDFNFFPKTWVLPGDYSDFKTHLNKKKIFIVKPEASSQGRGIFLIRKLEDINISERYVVQEYLNDPFLIEGLKFDLRIYVLVTSCCPLKVFVHEDGLTRLATEPYVNPAQGNFADMCVHLTNYAINKNNPNFLFNQDPEKDGIGHKRSLKWFYQYLAGLDLDAEGLKRKINDIIIKTLCAVQPSVSHIYKTCQPEDLTNTMCFELLGFDVIIDSNLNPYLLEVNHSPSFSTDSPLDWKIKHKVIKDTLVLLGSRVRDRKAYHQAKKEQPKRSSSVKQKEIKEEKVEKQKELVERTEKWQNSHLAGFTKIFPDTGKEKYDSFVQAANNMWYEISRHLPRGKKEEINKNVSNKITVKKKPQNSVPRRNLTLSSTSLQKLAHLMPPGEGREDELDEEVTSKYLKMYRANPGLMDLKEMVYYKHLEEILKDRRQAASFMRVNELNSKKPPKPVRLKEVSHGNYVTPKTFSFSPKVNPRAVENKK